MLTFLKAHNSEYISGQDLSDVLKISRVAVWKHVERIKSLGYKIDSKQKLGYKLVRNTELLLPWEIVDGIKEIFSLKNVAVVGMSKNKEKAAHYVPKYLSENGFNIIPVNPTADQILDKKSYHSLDEIDQDIDIVDVFRPSDQVLPFVKEAIKKKPKVIWLQEGIHNSEAEELARKEGIKVVFNRCMLAEHQRLF